MSVEVINAQPVALENLVTRIAADPTAIAMLAQAINPVIGAAPTQASILALLAGGNLSNAVVTPTSGTTALSLAAIAADAISGGSGLATETQARQTADTALGGSITALGSTCTGSFSSISASLTALDTLATGAVQAAALGVSVAPLDNTHHIPIAYIPTIPVGMISGLGNAAGSNFGTSSNTVADGGVVAALAATVAGAVQTAQIGVSIPALVSGKIALTNIPAIPASDVTGLGAAALAGFGTTAGSVPDAGAVYSALATETGNRQAAVASLQTSLQGSIGAVNSTATNALALATGSVPSSSVGVGVAPLDGNQLVPLANLPTIPTAKISGLSPSATSPFGTLTGQVADGGVLAAVATTASLAYPSSNPSHFTTTTIGTAAGTARDAALAIAAETAAQNTANAALPASQIGTLVPPLSGGVIPSQYVPPPSSTQVESALTSFDTAPLLVTPTGGTQTTLGAVAKSAVSALQLGGTVTVPGGGFGTQPINGVSNSGFAKSVSDFLNFGAALFLADLHNSGDDATPPGITPNTITTTGVWSTWDDYNADYAAGKTTNTSPIINGSIIMQAAERKLYAANSAAAIVGGTKLVCWIPQNFTSNFDRITINGTAAGGQVQLADGGEYYFHSAGKGIRPTFICSGDTKSSSVFPAGDGIFINQGIGSTTGVAKVFSLKGLGFTKGALSTTSGSGKFAQSLDSTDEWSGLFTQDIEGHWTGCAGSWLGLTPIFSAPLSANTAALALMTTTPGNSWTGASFSGTTMTVPSGQAAQVSTGVLISTATPGQIPPGTYVVSGSGTTWTISAAVPGNPSNLTVTANATDVLYFDQNGTDTGGNPTIAVQMISGAAGYRVHATATSINAATYANYIGTAPTGGLSLFNRRSIYLGNTAAQVVYLAPVSGPLAGFTGFAVVMGQTTNPDSNFGSQSQSSYLQFPILPAKAAQAASCATTTMPELLSRPAIPSPSVIHYTGQWNGGAAIWPVSSPAAINYPWFPRGHFINAFAERMDLEDLYVQGFSAGQAFVNGGAALGRDINCFVGNCDLRENTGGLRPNFTGGLYGDGTGLWSSQNLRIRTGDQPIEPQGNQQLVNKGNGGFPILSPFNATQVYMDVINCDASCPTAEALAVASGAQVTGAFTAFLLSVAVGNVLTLQALDTKTGVSPLDPLSPGNSSAVDALMIAMATTGAAYYNSGAYNGLAASALNKTTSNQLFYTFCRAAGTPGGSFLIAYAHNGDGTYTLTFAKPPVAALPPGAAQASVFIAAAANTPICFNVGVTGTQVAVPVGFQNSSIIARVFGGDFYSGAKLAALSVVNHNSSLRARLYMSGAPRIHGWWQWYGGNINLRNSGATGINLLGYCMGGVGLYGLVHVYDPGGQSLQGHGDIDLGLDDECLWGMPQAGRVAGFADSGVAANVYLIGAKGTFRGRVQGALQTPGAALPNMQIGDADKGSYGLGLAASGSCDDLVVEATFEFTQPGSGNTNATLNYAIVGYNSTSVQVRRSKFKQAAIPGSGAFVGGIHLPNATMSTPQATNWMLGNGLNFRLIDGAAVAIDGGTGQATAYQVDGNIIPGPSGLPVLPLSASFSAAMATYTPAPAAIQSAVISGLPTVLPSSSGTLWNNNGALAIS